MHGRGRGVAWSDGASPPMAARRLRAQTGANGYNAAAQVMGCVPCLTRRCSAGEKEGRWFVCSGSPRGSVVACSSRSRDSARGIWPLLQPLGRGKARCKQRGGRGQGSADSGHLTSTAAATAPAGSANRRGEPFWDPCGGGCSLWARRGLRVGETPTSLLPVPRALLRCHFFSKLVAIVRTPCTYLRVAQSGR